MNPYLMISACILTATIAFAGPVEDAKKQFQNKNYFKAIEVLQKAPKTTLERREETLYLLDKIIDAAVADIPNGDHYFEQSDKTQKQLAKLNIKLTVGHYDGLLYDHQNWRKLLVEFPKSKYKPELEYRFMDVYSLEDNVKSLREFIKKYPNNPIRWEANLQLARVLDNLWEDYYQSSKNPPQSNSGIRTKGSVSADQKESAHFKALALEEYSKVLKNHPDQAIQKDVQTRIVDLKNEKPSHIKYAEPD